jgi:hypothetical protein
MFTKFNIRILILIFVIAIFVRFINFHQSLYFGYDEARDAYTSQEIYTQGDLKLSGAPASASAGINHGPVYLYIIGPLFLLGHGDPYFVSAIFRIINASGVFLIFILGSVYASTAVGLIAAFIYAVSFEQYIYAIYTGNPSLSVLFWPILLTGAGLVYKKERRILGLFLMLFAAASVAQFDLIHVYAFGTLTILLFLLRNKIRGISFKSWFKIIILGLLPIYTYPLAEIKNHFLGIKTLFSIATNTEPFLSGGESKYMVLLRNFVRLFSDNILHFSLPFIISAILFAATLLFIFIKAKKNNILYFILIWIGSMAFLIGAKGFMPYYSYAGIGVGVILVVSILIKVVSNKNKFLIFLSLGVIALSNILLIKEQSLKALIVEIKAQPGMKLSDELTIIQKTYEYSKGEGFTIRITSMPYKIQTVWSYLYNQYGLPTYGYLPYLEGGNVEGYPGKLPLPISGTTCIRFYIKEPIRGIPQGLIDSDIQQEDLFSDVVKEETIGEFLLQTRKAKALDCHEIKATRL